VDLIWREIRHAVRSLYRDRRVALTAIVALALGIAASTTVFSVFYNLLFDSFHTRNAERLVIPFLYSPLAVQQTNVDSWPLHCSLEDYHDFRGQNHVFEDLAAFDSFQMLISDKQGTRMVRGAYVSENAFSFYGGNPLLGRTLVAEDAKPDSIPVFVLGYLPWRGEFNGDPTILGKTFVVDRKPRTLVGIMRPGYEAYGARMWMPLDASSSAGGTSASPQVRLMGRLKKGIGFNAASSELNSIFERNRKARPKAFFPEHSTIVAKSAVDFLMGPFGIGAVEGSTLAMKNSLYAILSGVLILLLIACGNVANLLLVRATLRRTEMTMRAALGASRGRLALQLFVESGVLACAACVAGCVLAYWGVKEAGAILPDHGQFASEAVVALNPAVLLFSVCATMVTTILCGLAPAMQTVRRDIYLGMAGRAANAEGMLQGKLRSVLVIGQVALSIVLLVGAGLLGRTLLALTHVELGFDAKNLLIGGPRRNGEERKQTPAENRVALRHEFDKVKSVAGVSSAAALGFLPGFGGPGCEATVGGRPDQKPIQVKLGVSDENLADTLGLRLVGGRWLDARDLDEAHHVAVVNQALVHAMFEGRNPLGQRIRLSAFVNDKNAEAAYFEIVGATADVRNFGLQAEVMPMAYVPYTIQGGAALLIRTKWNAETVSPEIVRALSATDPNVWWRFDSMESELKQLSYAPREFSVSALGLLAMLGLLLVGVGTASALSYLVSMRLQELGIRMALGAQKSDLLGLVLKRGFGLIGVGIVIGVTASFWLTRYIQSQVWGVRTTDLSTYSCAVGVILTAGLAACYFPARHAASVDPMIALRHE
jgi:putative ABC transport system permease protein